MSRELCKKPIPKMRTSYLSFALLCTVPVLGQAFERIYPFSGAINAAGGIVDARGHLVMAAVVEGDLTVLRLSAEGEVDWMRRYPYFTNEGFYGPGVVSSSEGIFVLGYTMGLGTISRDGLMLHLGFDGELLSTKRIDIGGTSNAFHSAKAIGHGFLATGRVSGENSYDMLLALFDPHGELTWARTYGSTEWDWAHDATPLAEGGYAVVGYGDGLITSQLTAAYVVKTGPDGEELWARGIGSGAAEEAYAVTEDVAGNIYVGGRTLGMGVPPPSTSGFITKFSPAGEHLWTRVLPNSIEVGSLGPAPGGGIIWAARPQNVPGGFGAYDIGWGIMDEDGDAVTTFIHGDTGNDVMNTMTPAIGGGWYFFGITDSYDGWAHYVIRTSGAEGLSCSGTEWGLDWVPFEPTVVPFTSITTERELNITNITMGNSALSIGSMDPCCFVKAGFEATVDGADPYTWSFSNNTTGGVSYSWDFGDGNTSTEVSPTHTFEGNGSYEVCLTAMGECGPAVQHCGTISITVGIAEAGTRNALRVFPVPADNEVRMAWASGLAVEVSVVDLNGRHIALPFVLRNGNGISMDVSALANGTYVAEVMLNDGQRMRAPIMIMR